MPHAPGPLPAASWLLVLSLVPLTATAVAQSPRTSTLLVDFDQTPTGPRSSNPYRALHDQNTTWFVATTRALGTELWQTDGTPAGTRVVDDLQTGELRSYGHEAAVLADGTLFVAATTLATGEEIWARAPGAVGLTLLADIVPGSRRSRPHGLTAWQGECWFLADDTQLWRSDGTPAGTRFVEDLSVHFSTPQRYVFPVAGPHGLWLTTERAELLHRATPNSATTPVTDAGSPVIITRTLGTLAGKLVFSRSTAAAGFEPAIHDPLSGTTISLGDLAPGTTSSDPLPLASGARRVWFSATDPQHGRELWVTDGTPTGTRFVSDVEPGPGSGVAPYRPAVVTSAGALLFQATNATVGVEAFLSDGTGTGTRPLLDIQPGPRDSWAGGIQLGTFTEFANRIWFAATDGVHGTELWSTDGTSAGTRLEFDLRAGPESGLNVLIAPTPAGLLLAGDDGSTGVEPWVFDPVTRTGNQLANLAVDPVNLGSGIQSWTVHDDFALLVPVTTGGIPRPFITRGSIHTTFPLAGFAVGAADATRVLGTLDGRGVVFSFHSSDGRSELWISDGRSPTCRLLTDFTTGPNPTAYEEPGVVFEDRLWFVKHGTGGAYSLWVTDGTAAGTSNLQTVPLLGDFAPRLAHGGLMYGQGADREPWVSDGTTAGTYRLADIAQGLDQSNARGFTPYGNGVFFLASPYPTGTEPWFSDGTTAGTRMILELVPGPAHSGIIGYVSLGNVVVLAVLRSSDGPLELWRSDATAAGTRILATLAPAGNGQIDVQFQRAGARVVITATMDWPDSAVWTSDGTPQGTTLLFDTASLGATVLGGLTVIGDAGDFVFEATDVVHGRELWASDGTLAGTRIVTDSQPGVGNAEPSRMFRLGDGVLFQADDGLTGHELHRIPLADFGAAVARPIGRGCGAHLDADGAPEIGQRFTLRIQASGGGPAGLVFDTAPSFGTPRPGCEIHLRNPTVLGNYATDSQGRASLPVQVPNDPALVGTLLYLQSVHLRSGGPLFGSLELTEGLELLVGR